MERSDTGNSLLGQPGGLLALRVCGTEHDGRVLHIRSPKCTIGADSSCTLRLLGPGVRPFHCLILRGTEGAFVRRLSPDTCLNGGGFDLARLQPADRLAIGPIQLEVLPSPPIPPADEPIAPETSCPPETRPDPELAQACQRLEETLRQSEQDRQRLQAAVAQAESAASRTQRLESELSAARGDLETTAAQHAAALAQIQTLESDLDETRRNLEATLTQREAVAARASTLEGELSATRQNLDEARVTATHTRAQLEAELNARDLHLTDVQKQLADRDQAAQTNWKDVAEKLRTELQQTREEHRRVRDEWHVDRQGFERELAARTAALQQLDQRSKQDMREAETLIQSMQQEGKHLLAQLEEARQTIHQDIDRRKKRQALARPGQAPGHDPPPAPSAPAADSPAPDSPAASDQHDPPHAAPDSSDCHTMLMDAAEFPQISPSPESGDGSQPAPVQPAAESTAPTTAEDAEEDERVIQSYMERLLRRVSRT